MQCKDCKWLYAWDQDACYILGFVDEEVEACDQVEEDRRQDDQVEKGTVQLEGQSYATLPTAPAIAELAQENSPHSTCQTVSVQK